MARYGMVIDRDRCTGCRTGMEACKTENNPPQGFFWMHVFRFEEGAYPNTRVRFMPRPCMHCENPPCVKACEACTAKPSPRYKREDGLVAPDRAGGARLQEPRAGPALRQGPAANRWRRPQSTGD